MSNEIKQGDKVKVSKDAPLLYTEGRIDWEAVESNVCRIDGDAAEIDYLNEDNDEFYRIVIPTKYLVKVDAEAKEPRFKKGDKVRYIGNIQEHKGEMFVIDGDIFFNDYYKQWQASSIKTTPTEVWGICNVPLSDLEPDTKPTEQTAAEKKPYDGISEETANEISNMLEAYAKALSGIADSFDWQRYAADLAKEIVLKTVNSASDQRPMSIADYAVSVAKAVVDGLKRK